MVIPLYLAECLAASERGKGTAVFQWLPTASMLFAALIGIYFSYRVLAVEKTGDARSPVRLQGSRMAQPLLGRAASRHPVFPVSLIVSESPRWLFKRGKKEQAHAALSRSRSPQQATRELHDMEEMAQRASTVSSTGKKVKSRCCAASTRSFVLACLVFSRTQTTGVNSIIAYNGPIL